MPLVYNVHTPSKTYALAFKDGETYEGLISRLTLKASSSPDNAASYFSAIKAQRDGAGVVYEYEGERWALEDDSDLEILLTRFPPGSASSATLHMNPPHARAHFEPDTRRSSKVESGGSQGRPAQDKPAVSAMKDNSRLSKQEGSRQGVVRDLGNGDARARGSDSPAKTKQARPASSGAHAHFPPDLGPVPKASHTEPGNYRSAVSTPAAAHHFPHASHAGNAQVASALTRPAKGEKVELVGRTLGTDKDAHGHTHQMLAPALTGEGGKNGRAPSVMSAVSRKSRYGDNSAEPLWETKKRAWLEFHNGTGVRTVMGKVGKIDNVRMLLKPGYKGVYVSRSFAIKAQLVDRKYSMGSSGYTGLQNLGQVAITVAGRTAHHSAMMSEEAHFDVVLGRQWVERMNVKIDPNDQTILTYMDTGDAIPCDIVVLKDEQGNKIHIT